MADDLYDPLKCLSIEDAEAYLDEVKEDGWLERVYARWDAEEEYRPRNREGRRRQCKGCSRQIKSCKCKYWWT